MRMEVTMGKREITDKRVRAIVTSINGFVYYAVEPPVYRHGLRVLFTGYSADSSLRWCGRYEIEYREVLEVRP
jgi:hypothetical protein